MLVPSTHRPTGGQATAIRFRRRKASVAPADRRRPANGARNAAAVATRSSTARTSSNMPRAACCRCPIRRRAGAIAGRDEPIVEESHTGAQVAAHCHGDAAAKMAVIAGVDSIEHGSFIKPTR